MYTPILHVKDFHEITKWDTPLLKTDIKHSRGNLPKAPGVSEILGMTKSLTYRRVRKKAPTAIEDGGVP